MYVIDIDLFFTTTCKSSPSKINYMVNSVYFIRLHVLNISYMLKVLTSLTRAIRKTFITVIDVI